MATISRFSVPPPATPWRAQYPSFHVARTTADPADGDKGDITVSDAGQTWMIDADVLSAFGRSLIDDPSASSGLVTLGAAPAVHTHATSDVTGLDAVLAGKASTGVVTSSADGLAPASGGGTANFLRADATWAAPPAGGGGIADAPNDGTQYGRQSLGWTAIPVPPTWSTLSGKPATFPPTLPIAESDVTNLTTDLAAKVTGPASVVTARIASFSGTTGKLIADSGKLISDFANSTHTHAESDVTNLVTDLAAKAPLASPTFTGVTTHPTGSAAAPSIVVAGTTTGLFGASNTVGIASTGVEVARFNGAGLGIGGGSPSGTQALLISKTTGITSLMESEAALNLTLRKYAAVANGFAELMFRRVRGTIALPTTVVQNDALGQVNYGYYDGAAYQDAAFLRATVIAATPSASDGEARLVGFLNPAGAVAPTEIVRFDHATGLSMFGANPVVDQNRIIRARSYTLATLPSAVAGGSIYVSDYLGGVKAWSDGTDWVVAVETLMLAVGDETTALTTGTAKITKRMPYKGKHAKIPRAEVNTVSSSGLPTFDIKKNGTTIFSTLLTIDASEKTSVTAAAAAVLSASTFADDDEFTIDITVAGTGTKGAKIAMYLKHIL